MFRFSSKFFRPSWIEFHMDSVRYNIHEIRKYIGNDVLLMAVVKGDAYGFGALDIAELSISAGANWLGVATLDEALFLRHTLERFVPILVLGIVHPQYLSVASRHRITVTAVSLVWIQEAAEIAQQSFDFHLKVDTGLNRIGCKTLDEVRLVTKIVSQNPYLNWTGAYTHFATAGGVEEEDKMYYYQQLELFHEFLTVIPHVDHKIIHCANSAATLMQSNKPFFNMVRMGKALFGYLNESLIPIPSQRSKKSLFSTLVLVKQLNAGERVGYGATFITSQKQWIGTVPLGYGEGFDARFSLNFVLVDEKRVPIVGEVSMDQLMVALPEEYPVGTIVTFIEKEANEFERIPNKLFPTAANRIPRVCFLDGSVVSIRNPILESFDFK